MTSKLTIENLSLKGKVETKENGAESAKLYLLDRVQTLKQKVQPIIEAIFGNLNFFLSMAQTTIRDEMTVQYDTEQQKSKAYTVTI